jgi:hypothetical protein
MKKIKELYRQNIYGIMGTLIFHILLVTGFWIAELKMDVKIKSEEAILLDFTVLEKNDEIKETKIADKKVKDENRDQLNTRYQNAGSNRAVNDAVKKDKFFDEAYKQDIEDAKKLVSEVDKQLTKKAPQIKKFEMPEATSVGQNPDSIKNTIYSGKSNIHYYLENRHHIRLPIPVYLARGGGEITIDIQVDRNGKVIKAEARPSGKIADPMLPVYATQAAERTIFNSDSKAPSVQRGTITYHFVAQ